MNKETVAQDWTWKRSVEQAQQRLAAKGLTRLPQPVYQYQDLGEIESIERLNEVDLANMQVRNSAWYSYVAVELAYAKAAFSAFEEMYDVLLGVEMNNINKHREGRMLKDVLQSLAVQGNENLKKSFQKRLDMLQDVTLLEGMVKGLEIRCRAVENESIRRASVRKLER